MESKAKALLGRGRRFNSLWDVQGPYLKFNPLTLSLELIADGLLTLLFSNETLHKFPR